MKAVIVGSIGSVVRSITIASEELNARNEALVHIGAMISYLQKKEAGAQLPEEIRACERVLVHYAKMVSEEMHGSADEVCRHCGFFDNESVEAFYKTFLSEEKALAVCRQ